MVAKCANPKCGHQFLQLSQGRLFLLPSSDDSPDLTWKVDRLTDHCYWLCPDCAQEYTLERRGGQLLVNQREQARTPDVSAHPTAA